MIDKNKVIKIIVPVLIICVIGSIWFFKNRDEASLVKPVETAVGSSEISTNDKAMINTLEATSLDLDELKSQGIPIVIDFGADKCIPCKEMAPILKELSENYKGKVIVKFVDVWKYPELAEQFPLEVIPTQFFFDKEGNPYMPKDAEKMGMQLYKMKDTGDHGFTAHQGGMTKEQFLTIFDELGVKP